MERLCQGEENQQTLENRVSLWYRLESRKAPNTRTDPLAQKLPPLNFAKKTAIGGGWSVEGNSTISNLLIVIGFWGSAKS